jgi:hypothetical protein
LPPRRTWSGDWVENSGGLWGGRKKWCVRRTLRSLHRMEGPGQRADWGWRESGVPKCNLGTRSGASGAAGKIPPNPPLREGGESLEKVLDRAGVIGYKSPLPGRRAG